MRNGLELYVEESVHTDLLSLVKARESAQNNVIDKDYNEDKSDVLQSKEDIKIESILKSKSEYKSELKSEYSQDNIKFEVFDKNRPRKQGIDLVIAFGGDGLLMHCNTLFGGGSIPPSMCFDFGSLGFLAPFDYKDFELEVRIFVFGYYMYVY